MGELPRGKVAELTGMSERAARNLLASLLEEGLLIATSEWHRSTVRLGSPRTRQATSSRICSH